MSTEKRTRRSASQIAADLEIQLANAKARAAMEEAENNPALAPFKAALDTVSTDLSEARKGLTTSTPAQSFEARIMGHELWIGEIQAGYNRAQFRSTALGAIRDELREALSDAASAVAVGEDPGDVDDIVQSVYDNHAEEMAELETLEEAYTQANSLRVQYGEARSRGDVSAFFPES